jgi:hypothetical protein
LLHCYDLFSSEYLVINNAPKPTFLAGQLHHTQNRWWGYESQVAILNRYVLGRCKQATLLSNFLASSKKTSAAINVHLAVYLRQPEPHSNIIFINYLPMIPHIHHTWKILANPTLRLSARRVRSCAGRNSSARTPWRSFLITTQDGYYVSGRWFYLNAWWWCKD